MKKQVSQIWTVVLFTASTSLWAAPQVMYVQASRADLRAQPKTSSPSVEVVKRGAKLDILEKSAVWYRAKSAKTEGWISRLFLSAHRPVGNAELMKTLPQSVEKVSRRRSSEYAVAASARGLMSEERAREGQNIYRADFEALEKMESYALSQGKLDKFRSSARISTE